MLGDDPYLARQMSVFYQLSYRGVSRGSRFQVGCRRDQEHKGYTTQGLDRFRPPIWRNTLRPVLVDCIAYELIVFRGGPCPALYTRGAGLQVGFE